MNVAVGRDTELAYRIFPSMADGDRDYDATNVSVDLAFTDGTYLSDLRAQDQHGFALTPQGQGAAKVLYVNQWNNVVSRIGSVAAGRTVDRILVAYDSPKGPGEVPRLAGRREPEVQKPEKPKAHLSDYASTTRGTNSSGGFSRGNNFPATAVPHGFNFWTPVTNAGSLSWLYDYARAQQRGQPADPPGVQREPRAEPLDGRPADLPGDAVGRVRHPGRRAAPPARCPSSTRTRRHARTTTGCGSRTG